MRLGKSGKAEAESKAKIYYFQRPLAKLIKLGRTILASEILRRSAADLPEIYGEGARSSYEG